MQWKNNIETVNDIRVKSAAVVSYLCTFFYDKWEKLRLKRRENVMFLIVVVIQYHFNICYDINIPLIWTQLHRTSCKAFSSFSTKTKQRGLIQTCLSGQIYNNYTTKCASVHVLQSDLEQIPEALRLPQSSGYLLGTSLPSFVIDVCQMRDKNLHSVSWPDRNSFSNFRLAADGISHPPRTER